MPTQDFHTQSTTSLGIQEVLQPLMEQGASFAWWRLPNEASACLLINFSKAQKVSQPEVEKMPVGFLMSPFINPDLRDCTFLKADVLFTTEWKSGRFQIPAEEVENKGLSISIAKEHTSEKNPLPLHLSTQGRPESTSKEEYIYTVTQAVKAINQGHFQKVVPSRVKKVDFEAPFDLIDNFERLCEAYPRAMIMAYSVPELGTWMAATPETLIKVDQGIFKTIALAGTQALQADQLASDVTWTQKEIEEQALVSRYIINCFKQIRLREFEEHGPRTVAAGNLIHLKTEFEVDMQKTGFPTLGSVMLNLLHPTSAVCGMPKAPALAFIHQYEQHPRQLFSGFSGPVNTQGGTHLFVNLRCMQIQADHILLYAGAGVTEDSNPEKEWNETEMKCNTLLNVIRFV